MIRIGGSSTIVREPTAKSGAPIVYTANTVFPTVPAHDRLTVREINMGFGISLDCSQAAGACCRIGNEPRLDRMSDERGETVDLAYIGRALQRLTSEVASLRDDMQVLTAIALRHETMLMRLDETLNGVLQQITAMVAQNARVVDRLRSLDDRVSAVEDKAR